MKNKTLRLIEIPIWVALILAVLIVASIEAAIFMLWVAIARWLVYAQGLVAYKQGQVDAVKTLQRRQEGDFIYLKTNLYECETVRFKVTTADDWARRKGVDSRW